MNFTPKVVRPPQPGTRLAPTPDHLSVAYSPEGDLLCVGSNMGAISTWHSTDFTPSPLQLSAAMNEGRYMTSAVPCVRFQPVARSMKCVVAAASTDGTLSQWHVTSGRFLHGVKETGNEIYTLGHSPTGLWLAAAGKDCQVRVYNDERSVLDMTLQSGTEEGVPAHSSRIQALRWTSPFTLVTGGWDRTVQLWDVRQMRATQSIFGPYICGEGLDVHGHHIVTASTRDADVDALQLWDTRAPKEPMATVRLPNSTPDVMPSQLFAAQFSPDGKFIAVGGTSTLVVIETASAASARLQVHGEFMPEGKTPAAVFSVAWHPRSTAVAAVGASSSLIVLGVSL